MQTKVTHSPFFPFLKKHSISAVFIGGFAFDIFLLPDVDHLVTIILGTSYVILFSVCLFFRELLIKGNKVDDEEKETYKLLTFLISFFSGSSLSYIFTYSLRSADLSLSFPFLIIFFSILISNELITSHRFRLLFDYVLLTISGSFYFIYMTPLITSMFDDKSLYIGVFGSAFFIYCYTALFSYHSEFGDMIKPKGNAISFSLPLIIFFLALNFLLPPVPFKVEKVSVVSGSFFYEREKTFIAKIVTINEEKEIIIPKINTETLSYMTIYSLPEGVISNPEHVWYKKNKDGTLSQVNFLIKIENNTSSLRSIRTEIKKEEGEYVVVTRVGKRVIREDTIMVK